MIDHDSPTLTRVYAIVCYTDLAKVALLTDISNQVRDFV